MSATQNSKSAPVGITESLEYLTERNRPDPEHELGLETIAKAKLEEFIAIEELFRRVEGEE